jgi:2-keto-3-deoxy-L-rhamnonate aldolase
MVALPPPHGVYVPVPTFFVSRNSPRYNAAAAPLDLETQAKHSLHLARCGIRGLVLLGSTGEAVALTNAERVAVISHVRQSLAKDGYPDYPLVAGTATQGIVETVQQLKEAKDAGAQWGLCLAPGYFAPQVTPEGIEAWYRAVADESPLPIMMYVFWL